MKRTITSPTKRQPSTPPRLTLDRETIRILSLEQLKDVVGGECPNGSLSGSERQDTCA